MSNLQIIETLCGLLADAAKIIREQAEILEMHGIKTSSGTLEDQRRELLERIEREGWSA